MHDNPQINNELRSHLKSILRRAITLHVSSGLVSAVALGAWVFLGIIIWTAASNEPALWQTVVVSRGAIAVLVALLLYFVALPLARMPRLNTIAAEVEKRKDLKELLRAGYEFSQDEDASKRYAPALVKEVIQQAVRSITGLQVRFMFLGRKQLALLPVGYGGLAVLLILALAQPSLLSDAGHRIAAPSDVAAEEHRANIYGSPGNMTVVAGSDVDVAGLDFGRTEQAVTISYNLSEDFWKTEPTERRDDHTVADREAFDRYQYTFADLRHTVSYYFESGDYRSETYTITVVHKPILNDITLRLTPPEYTGEEPVTLEDSGGNVTALEGTRVEVTATANNVLAGAWAQFDGKDRKQIEYDGRAVSFDFRALNDGYYSVLLEDQLGHKIEEPLTHTVEVFKDNVPSLDVLEPGGDTTLPRNQLLKVSFLASDDYGVSRVAIYHRKSGEETYTRVGVPLAEQKNSRDVALAYEWDLAGLELFPGNYVEYFIQVADNNVVTGPGMTKSRTFQVLVPTMAELYDQVQEDEGKRDDLFTEAIKESEDLRERLEKITREFIKTEKMEWSQKKEVDKALEKQETIEETLQEIKQSLDDTLQEMSDNQMTSQEIGEKMEEVRELLEQIDSEALKKYMEELKEAVDNLSPEEIKEALKNMNLSTEDMLERLERTAALLREIQKEQEMEELVRKSEDLMKAQDELSEETSEADGGDQQKMDELAKKQDQLAEKGDELQESLQQFAEEMKEDDSQVSQQLSEASQQMSQEDSPQNDMREASEEMQSGQQQQAMREQQEAMQKLITLFQKIGRTQQAMQQNSGRKMAANLQKFAQQTLELSFKQETLADALQEQRIGDSAVNLQELAHDQMSYARATERVANELVKLSGQSLAVSPQLLEALGESLDRMRSSVLFLEQNKPFMSTAHANNAVTSLNKATIELLSGAKQCSSGQQGNSQGMAQSMLQQLIPQQRDVMQQTRQMLEMQMMQEMMRQGQSSQMERLAGQQRALKELAEQIQNSLKNNRDILGRMDRTPEDMEAVAKALEKGKLDEQTVEKEQRILSRLLDAARSIHTKDYEKKRLSTTAEDVFSSGAEAANKKLLSQSLREEIRRAMQLKAPGEFEDLIKLYFRALAEESSLRGGAGGTERN